MYLPLPGRIPVARLGGQLEAILQGGALGPPVAFLQVQQHPPELPVRQPHPVVPLDLPLAIHQQIRLVADHHAGVAQAGELGHELVFEGLFGLGGFGHGAERCFVRWVVFRGVGKVLFIGQLVRS